MKQNKKQVPEQKSVGEENLKNKAQAPKDTEPSKKEKEPKDNDDLDDKDSLKSNSLF